MSQKIHQESSPTLTSNVNLEGSYFNFGPEIREQWDILEKNSAAFFKGLSELYQNLKKELAGIIAELPLLFKEIKTEVSRTHVPLTPFEGVNLPEANRKALRKYGVVHVENNPAPNMYERRKPSPSVYGNRQVNGSWSKPE